MNQAAAAPGAFSFAAAFEAFNRHKWAAVWASVIILVITVGIAAFWPATYRSVGTILIEQQELPSDLVQSTITSYADQRIQVISQRVMTTDNLLRIIQRYNLYPKERESEPREALLTRMRKDIQFQMISADVMDPKQGRATKANIAFSISYDSKSSEIAARVANELVSLYLDENVKSRRQETADAATFLEDQADKQSKVIDALQSDVAKFKDKHLNSLPEQVQFNNSLLERTQEEQRDVETQLRALDQQATSLDAQLAQISPTSQVYTSTGERVLSPADRLKFLRTEYARLSAIYSPTHPDVMRVKREIDGLEKSVGTPVDSSADLKRQLDDARSQLASLQQKYAPDYPDVIKLQRQVDTLTQALNSAAPLVAATPDVNADNPAYIEVKAQRQAAEAQRSSLEKKREDLTASLSVIEARLLASPSVERDYTELVRELDADQAKYREIKQKQMEATLSQNLEDEQKGERFTLIDPPVASEIPVSPNRLLVLVVGVLLAALVAGAQVYVLESTDQSVRNRRDLEMLLRVSPLAILPKIFTSSDLATQRRQRVFAVASAIGVLAVALVLTHFFYRPLDVVWDTAMRRFGS